MVNVADFSEVIGDGEADVTSALNRAAQAVPENGVLYLPRGRYRINRSIALKSTTTLTGPEATIFSVADAALSESHPLVSNVGQGDTVIWDHNITVENIGFEYLGPVTGGSHAIEFRKVRGVIIKTCQFLGGNNGTALIACQDTNVADCVANGTSNCAFDHWGGSSQCLVRNCVALFAEGYGILFTGVGTDPRDHEQASDLTALDNTIRFPTQAGIWACSLSQHSSVSHVRLYRNRIYGGVKKTHGIGATGAILDFHALDNVIEGVQGGQALFTRPDDWNRPRNIEFSGNRLVWCSMPDNALIQAFGDNVKVAHNRAIGGHYPSLVATDGKDVTLVDNF